MKNIDLFVAIRRKKENPNLKEHTIRHIIRDYDKDLNLIKTMIKNNNGIYRIYKTVNSRNTSLAWKEFQHKSIENPEIYDRLESEWKTALLQTKCKAENKLLIDIDTKNPDIFLKVCDLIGRDNITHISETPNGYHIVCHRVDVREVEKYNLELKNDKDVIEVKRDALLFIEIAEGYKINKGV